MIVAGGGAAGLLAAIFSARAGVSTLLLDKNRKAGVKILMSGGTRCNVTQDTDWRGIAAAFGGRQGRFLKYPLASFPPDHTARFFEAAGVPLKTEATGKVFPVSDRAIDVRDALLSEATAAGVHLLSGVPVTGIERSGDGFAVATRQETFTSGQLILATGGQSYPGCGTTGDGYAWVRRLGHRVRPPRPALTPVRISEPWVHGLAGITVPDMQARVVAADPSSGGPVEDVRPAGDRGSFLFTHRGCSGPVVLNISRGITDPGWPVGKHLLCDWIPERNQDELRSQLLDPESASTPVSDALAAGLPRRLLQSIAQTAGISERMRLGELGRKRIARLVSGLKQGLLTIDGTLGFAKAEVTAGGVELDEVNPRTMASRQAPGLFLAGEILDVDGPIGGYNFQAAWSTGRLAGISAARASQVETRGNG